MRTGFEWPTDLNEEVKCSVCGGTVAVVEVQEHEVIGGGCRRVRTERMLRAHGWAVSHGGQRVALPVEFPYVFVPDAGGYVFSQGASYTVWVPAIIVKELAHPRSQSLVVVCQSPETVEIVEAAFAMGGMVAKLAAIEAIRAHPASSWTPWPPCPVPTRLGEVGRVAFDDREAPCRAV